MSTKGPIQKALGFQKAYNVPLYAMSSAGLLYLVFFRLAYLSPSYLEAHVESQNLYQYNHSPLTRAAFVLHLVSVLPAAAIATVQFLPKARNFSIGAHRYLGRTSIVLAWISVVTAYIITPSSYGGAPLYQAGLYVLGLFVSLALGLAWYNIRVSQIDQHRNWMIRSWAWAGAVVTLRPLNEILILLLRYVVPHYHSVFSCDEVNFIQSAVANTTALAFPACVAALDPKNTFVAVATDPTTVVGYQSTLRLTFPMAAWVSVALHLVICEAYLHLTSAESERLRQVSYKIQLKRGLVNPGSAGLTTDVWGDGAKFVPAAKAA